MQMVNTRTHKTNLKQQLAANTVAFLFPQDTVAATKYLMLHRIPYQIMMSGEGYWINVFWKNGITAPLTCQELTQLPDYLVHTT
jgi:hypothetical protein